MVAIQNYVTKEFTFEKFCRGNQKSESIKIIFRTTCGGVAKFFFLNSNLQIFQVKKKISSVEQRLSSMKTV